MRRYSDRDLDGGPHGEEGSALAIKSATSQDSEEAFVGEQDSEMQAALRLARQAPAESTVEAIMYEVQAVTAQLVAPFRITAEPRKYLAG